MRFSVPSIKCSAAVVGLDLLLGLSMVRRCSLNRSFNRRFVSPMYCKITAVTLNHVDEVFSITGEVRFYGARFPSRKEGICSKSVRNVGTSSTVFATTERTSETTIQRADTTRWQVDTTRRQVENTTRRDDKLTWRKTSWDDDTASWHDEMTSWHDETTSWSDVTTSWHDEMTSWSDVTTSWHDETTSWSDETTRWKFCPRFDAIAFTYICYLPAGRSVWWKNVTEVLKSPRSQFFTIRTDPKPANNMSIFFPTVNWFYRLQMGLVTQPLSLNRLPRRLLTSKKSRQRASNSDSRQRKMY